MFPSQIPNLNQVKQYAVNRAGVEAIKQSLYDYQLYPAAGVAQLNFFALPQGQGVATALGAVVGSAKTIADTNMNTAGALPAGQEFLVSGVEVHFMPGTVSTANTYTPALPSFFAAVAAATVTAQLDDVAKFYQSGSLKFFIGSKTYLEEGPLFRFPPINRTSVMGGVASNSATTSEVGFAHAAAMGMGYTVNPMIQLISTQNFVVQLNFPAAVATASTFNGRVGVILDGILYRNSQ